MGDIPRTGLALTALRYAAGELPPTETAVFGAQLAVDQTARDALSEAIRLSAAALGRPTPTPDPLTRGAILDRLRPTLFTRAFPRRPYRGHPLAWAGLGGTVAAGLTAFGVWLADPPAGPATVATVRTVESLPTLQPVLVAECAPAPRPVRPAPTVVAEATPSPALAATRADVRPPAPAAKPSPEEEATPPAIEGPPHDPSPARTATDPTAGTPRPARQPAEPSSFNPSLDPGAL